VTRRPPLPAVPERFPPRFAALLRELLGRSSSVLGGRIEHQRARRAALSQSGTFVGHRHYVRGDDPRRIDWAASARSGDLFVKLFEEEERRTATLVLDLSPSLLVGSPPRRLAALRLAAVVAGLALRHLDGVSIVAPGAGALALATFAGAADLEPMLRHLDAMPLATVAPETAIPLVLQRGISGRVHWISDFAEPDAFELPLSALRRRGAFVTGWLPALPEDHDVPSRGHVQLWDPESGESFGAALDAALAKEMRTQLERLARRQDHLFAQLGSPLVRWPAPAADDFGITAWQEIVARCAR
jgi:uncharacterized protein (DUF58 family)